MPFNDLPVLLVEDNEDDTFIFGRAYKQTQSRYPMYFVQNGEQAIDYLAGRGAYTDRTSFPVPFLVLLDLKLPLCTGLNVLEWMATQPALAAVSVVVLTSSAESRDVRRARELGARAYLLKPPTPGVLTNLFAALRRAPVPGGPDHRLSFEGDLFSVEPLAG
jgi:CheY-like chemotaxis protein